jgi:fatty-acyl-CoA synthase
VSGQLVLGRWIRDRARTTPERVAIDYDGRHVTYAELDVRSDRLAADLLAAGLKRGDRVATLTGNSPEHVEAFFACAKAGFVLVPLSWRLSPVELAYQLDDSEPAVFLVEDEYAELADATLAEASVRPERRRVGEVLGGEGRVAADVADDDPLFLIYTSGTTGKPKGALLTHANCFWTNVSFDLGTGMAGDDVALQLLPQFHCGGWNVQPLLTWWKGGTVVLERTFDAERCLRLVAEKRVTTLMGVPAIYLFMAQEPGFDDADLSSVRRAVVGGAPMPEALLETWHARGIDIVQGYGLTEAAPNVLCLPAEDAVRKLGFAGKPYPYVEVALRDPESGRLLDGTGAGELVVRGPNIFAGYWRNPEASAAATADGWLLTGDVAERDEEGYYRICARLKDMYISGGENVYPAEVESVLHEHPAVADAAVIAVADERWGEAGIAAVVVAEGHEVDEDELIEHCRTRLAGFKVPRGVRFVDELPRSGMGKVLKDELRGLIVEETSA